MAAYDTRDSFPTLMNRAASQTTERHDLGQLSLVVIFEFDGLEQNLVPASEC